MPGIKNALSLGMMSLVFYLIIALVISPVSIFAQNNVSAIITKASDAEHIEFYGKEKWDYDFKKVNDIFELSIANISDESLKKLYSFQGSFIKKIEVAKDTVDSKKIIKFVLASNDVESFDYLTDQPSRLIIDFYKKEAPKVAKVVNTAIKAEPKKTTVKSNSKSDRNIASDELNFEKTEDESKLKTQKEDEESDKNKKIVKGIFDGADPNFARFQLNEYEIKEASLIKSALNTYLAFPVLYPEFNHLNKIHSNMPIYQIIPADLKENKEARLLQVLFEKNRTATFHKTLEWFREKYPTSQYNELINFMEADVFYKQWLENQKLEDFELAMLKYRKCLENFPDTKLKQRTLMLMGFATLKRGDSLGAIRIFQDYIKNNSGNPNSDIAQIAIARAFIQLNKYDEAILNLEIVEKNALKVESKVEAAFLKGDVNFLRKNYTAALKNYEDNLAKYPEAADLYPSALFNQSEAHFWLKDYKKSLAAHLEFLKKFPDHPFAGFSITRVGESLEILGAKDDKVLGAYLEAQFRYGQNPNAIVAKIRLARIKMPTMKEKEIEQTITDLIKISEKETLPGLLPFTLIQISDALSERGDNERSIKLLAEYYQKNPTSVDQKTFKERIVNYINSELKSKIDKKEFIQALQLRAKYKKTWLTFSDRIDTNYYIANAFEQAGVYKTAEIEYLKTYNQLVSFKGTSLEKEKSVFEKVPSLEELSLRITSVLTKNEKWQEAYEYFKQIKNTQVLTQEEEIERVYLGAKILQKRGDYATAKTYLVQLLNEWSGQPTKVAPLYFELSEIEMKMNQKDESIESLQKIVNLTQENSNIASDLQIKTLTRISDLYLEKNQTDKAISTIDQMLTQFDSKNSLDSYRYKLGDLYFKKGDLKNANLTWNKLAEKENSFWYKLAKEKMVSADWNKNYKKYIQRAPASNGQEVQ